MNQQESKATKYDWSNVPDWVQWICSDDEGTVWGTAELPNISIFTNEWSIPHRSQCTKLPQCKPCTNWRESLEHRARPGASYQLHHGDCIELMRELSPSSVDMILTDIPYDAVSKNGEERAKYSGQMRKIDKGTADILSFDLKNFLDECDRVSRGYVVIFCGKEQFSTIFSYFSNKKGTTRALIWEKNNPSPMNGQHIYLSGVELAVWFKRSGHKTFNAHCKNTVLKHSNGRSKNHPTEKNMNLWIEIIKDCTNVGDTVLDNCMGSGTTGVACIKTNRKFIGIEKDDHYFNVAKERIAAECTNTLFGAIA